MYGGKEKYDKLVDEAVKYSQHKFDSAIDEFASKVKPGDVVLLTLKAHGGPCTYEGYLNAYGKEEADRLKKMGYFDKPVVRSIGSRPLAEDIKKLEEKGATVVALIDVCYSGCYIKHLEDYNITGNVVMLTSTPIDKSGGGVINGFFTNLKTNVYDMNKDGFISVKEAWFGVKIHCAAIAKNESDFYFPQEFDPNNNMEKIYLSERGSDLIDPEQYYTFFTGVWCGEYIRYRENVERFKEKFKDEYFKD